jgi:hypothetical protein
MVLDSTAKRNGELKSSVGEYLVGCHAAQALAGPVSVASSRDFGKYWRIRPLAFSFNPRCHEAYGSAK